MINDALNHKIRRVAGEQGITPPHWSKLRKALNAAGVKAPKGNVWAHDIQVKRYCDAHKVFEATTKSTTGAPRDTVIVSQVEREEQVPMPRPETPNTGSQIPQLDAETVAVLREIVSWWKARGAETMTREETTEPAYRPNFPGTRRNTGIRINARLLQDALEKAQTPAESVKTGGGLSPLIERLLWQYLGFDPKYLRIPDLNP